MVVCRVFREKKRKERSRTWIATGTVVTQWTWTTVTSGEPVEARARAAADTPRGTIWSCQVARAEIRAAWSIEVGAICSSTEGDGRKVIGTRPWSVIDIEAKEIAMEIQLPIWEGRKLKLGGNGSAEPVFVQVSAHRRLVLFVFRCICLLVCCLFFPWGTKKTYKKERTSSWPNSVGMVPMSRLLYTFLKTSPGEQGESDEF